MSLNYSNLAELFEKSRDNHRAFRGGAFPYKQWQYLHLITKMKQPKKILELGTGIGLTAITMKLACPHSRVDTIDMNERNVTIARQNASDFGTEINFIQGELQDVLKNLDQDYDLVFFDGFEANLSQFTMLENHLKIGGLMVCANVWNEPNCPSPCWLQMQKEELYTSFFYFDDTATAIRVS